MGEDVERAVARRPVVIHGFRLLPGPFEVAGGGPVGRSPVGQLDGEDGPGRPFVEFDAPVVSDALAERLPDHRVSKAERPTQRDGRIGGPLAEFAVDERVGGVPEFGLRAIDHSGEHRQRDALVGQRLETGVDHRAYRVGQFQFRVVRGVGTGVRIDDPLGL